MANPTYHYSPSDRTVIRTGDFNNALLAALAGKTNSSGSWIIWSPTSKQAPQKRFFSPDQARAVAHSMAEQHPGQEFYVCKLEGVAVKPLVQPDTYKPL